MKIFEVGKKIFEKLLMVIWGILKEVKVFLKFFEDSWR